MSKDNNLEWQNGDLPYSQEFGDHFYSRADGRLECDHVFLRGNNVQERWTATERFSIGELGFGTGLNLLETWRQWVEQRKAGQTLLFTSFELYPMQASEIERALKSWPILGEQTGVLIENWNAVTKGKLVALDGQTFFQLVVGDVREMLPIWDGAADAWFLDGFAPSKNPQMWEEEMLKALARKTNPGGTVATYTAAGWVRRNLIAAGFDMQKCPGHAGKREMMKGVFQSQD